MGTSREGSCCATPDLLPSMHAPTLDLPCEVFKNRADVALKGHGGVELMIELD